MTKLKILYCLFTALCVSVVGAAPDEVSCDLGDSIYSQIVKLARTQSYAEASSKFKCEFNFGGGSWTNGTEKAFFIEQDSRWIKVDDQGRVAQVGPKSTFPEFVWVENRERMLIAELQTKEPFATKIAALKKKKADEKAKKDAEEAEIARINSICIDELFGIKFGSDEYQFSRTNLNDRLGLSNPTDKWGSRKVRLPKPEFGFTHGSIRCTESGTVYMVCAKMTIYGKDGVSAASKGEVCAVITNIVNTYSKRYGIDFVAIKSTVDPERFCGTYRFEQERRHFLFFIKGDMRPSKKSLPEVKIEAYYCGHLPGVVDLRGRPRLERTWTEENDYNQNVVISNICGFTFGDIKPFFAGQTVTQRLGQVNGVFESAQLSYNATGCLYQVSLVAMKNEYADKHRVSFDVASEALHRDIVRIVREIEDQYQISSLAREIGDDLTEENDFTISNLWPWKREGAVSWVNRNAKMSVRTREDRMLVSITITNNALSKKGGVRSKPSENSPASPVHQRRANGLLRSRSPLRP